MTQELPSPSRGVLALAAQSYFSNIVDSPWKQILLLEDNAARAQRRRTAGIRAPVNRDVIVRLHKIASSSIAVVAESAYSPGSLRKTAQGSSRINFALDLLNSIKFRPKETVIVTGTRYAGSLEFTRGLLQRGFHWAIELPRRAVVATKDYPHGVCVRALLKPAVWRNHSLISPVSGTRIPYSVAHLAYTFGLDGSRTRLFAAQVGAIDGVHPGTIIGLSSELGAPLDSLLQAVCWARWIRPLVRLEERKLINPSREQPSRRSNGKAAVLALRSNIKLALQHDQSAPWNGARETSATRVGRAMENTGLLSQGRDSDSSYADSGSSSAGTVKDTHRASATYTTSTGCRRVTAHLTLGKNRCHGELKSRNGWAGRTRSKTSSIFLR
jgi:hypothetical protein